MTIPGIVFLDLVGAAMLLWVLDLVRRGRLYVGYGVIIVAAILGTMATISIPWLWVAVIGSFRTLFPVPSVAPIVFALCFIGVMLIYILTQITVIANRLALVVQELAIERSMKEGTGGRQGNGTTADGR